MSPPWEVALLQSVAVAARADSQLTTSPSPWTLRECTATTSGASPAGSDPQPPPVQPGHPVIRNHWPTRQPRLSRLNCDPATAVLIGPTATHLTTWDPFHLRPAAANLDVSVTGWQSKRPLLSQTGPLTCGFTVAGAGQTEVVAAQRTFHRSGFGRGPSGPGGKLAKRTRPQRS